MATLRQGRADYLIRAGFGRGEARELSRITRDGMQAPYVRQMVNSRRSLKARATQLGWSDKQLSDYIKNQYVKKGFLKSDKIGRKRVDPWALFRDYADKFTATGQEYESIYITKMKVKSVKKREAKHIKRSDMLKSWISQIDNNLKRTTNERKIAQLQKQRDNLQAQLDKIEKKSE